MGKSPQTLFVAVLLPLLAASPAVFAQQQAGTPNPNQAAIARQIVANADQAYQSGLIHYRQNKMDAARADFDRAVDELLSSNLKVRDTPELSDELDKLLDGINQLEMASLEQGGGLVQQTEISPAEEANNVTFPVDPNLRAAAEAEVKTMGSKSDLPLLVNEPVASFISFFSQSRNGHATLSRSLERAGRYKDMIQRVLREEGVPQDLIYQAVAESGFQPKAFNRSGAAGMWQFMPGTGALYGLRRDSWMDERYDPEKATRAYARYMKALYNQFGDWWLAMAAYDWGSAGVQRAVEKTGYASFWDLHRLNVLPAETKNYVPIILAAAIIAKNPQQYGVTGLNPAPPMLADTVTTHSAVSLRLAADVTNTTLDDLVGMNPALTRLSTPPGEAYDLRVPAGTGKLFNDRLARIPDDRRDSWRFHTVAAGESLSDIAHSFHSDADQIAQVNQISGSSLTEGQGLVIPVSSSGATGAARMTTRYTTRRGDTVVSVADRFGVSAAQLRSWNGLKSNSIPPGHVLRVASPANTAPAARSHGKHGRASTASAGHSPGSKAGHHATATTHSSGSTKKSGNKKHHP